MVPILSCGDIGSICETCRVRHIIEQSNSSQVLRPPYPFVAAQFIEPEVLHHKKGVINCVATKMKISKFFV